MEQQIKRYRRALFVPVLVMTVLLLYYLRLPSEKEYAQSLALRYPHQTNYHHYASSDIVVYNFMVISDMDKKSRIEVNGKPMWQSLARYGTLTRDTQTGDYSLDWIAEKTFFLNFNDGARGMELSDLCYFNGKLYTFDDRTGLVMEILENRVVPATILMDGNGKATKGFKGEWCTVKDDLLYIGGMGKEWTNQNGETEGYDPQWVKTIDLHGVVRHHDWRNNYELLRSTTGTLYPGYLLHEAVVWDSVHRRWIFFPRRVSKEPYDEEADEHRGGRIAILVDEDFTSASVADLPSSPDKTRGYSASKLIPFRENEAVLLKTTEVGTVTTYLTVVDLETKKTLFRETEIGNIKFEGIEFL